MNWISFFAVGFGAFGGAVLRWGLGLAFNAAFPTLPLGTLAANLLGGLLMGVAIGGLPAFQALPPAG
ncbi:MAG TPA: CrcB family protein, partial [Holophagaceae bacterium]|nr:CrcB family protein [Holophagaceae bacterium]